MSMHKMAAQATLHCLTGCALGEVAGLVIGTAVGLSNSLTIALSVSLAFLFGYTLSLLPLLSGGLSFKKAARIALAADTLSIATMELVDNAVMLVVPGAMSAGLANPLFWLTMAVALVVAFGAAFPVNLYLLSKGKGHALAHGGHSAPSHGHVMSTSLQTKLLAAGLVIFIVGGLIVSLFV